MARIRSVKPEFWTDEKIGRMDRTQRLLFLGILNCADDEGIAPCNPIYLRTQIFPYDDDLSNDEIARAVDKFQDLGLVYRYKRDDSEYLWVINFRKHQRIDKPQKPKYPTPSIQNRDFLDAIFRRDKFTCHLCGEETGGNEVNVCGSKAPSIDHVIPKSRGGTNYPSNLATACLSCNKAKRAKILGEFAEDSKNATGPFVEDSTREGKGSGRERKRKGSGSGREGSGEGTSPDSPTGADAGGGLPGAPPPAAPNAADDGKGNGASKDEDKPLSPEEMDREVQKLLDEHRKTPMSGDVISEKLRKIGLSHLAVLQIAPLFLNLHKYEGNQENPSHEDAPG